MMLTCSIWISSIEKVMESLWSSANPNREQVKHLPKSLTCMMNKRGPKFDPWGTEMEIKDTTGENLKADSGNQNY